MPRIRFFGDQVGLNSVYEDLFDTIATVATILVLLALRLVDTELVRHKNALDTSVQNLVAALPAAWKP